MPRTGAGNNQTQGNAARGSQDHPDFVAKIAQWNPERGLVATADVQIGSFMTIRNVKIRESDYGYEVVMPKTTLKDTGELKDSVYFSSRELKDAFDKAVTKACQEMLTGESMVEEADEDIVVEGQDAGMSQGMGM